MILKGGNNICEVPLGVISLESYFPKPARHIKHPASFAFPILYKTVRGATIERLITQQDPELLTPFITAAKALQQEGVRAITGSCGFLVLHQQALADAVEIPVLMSSLLQVPLVARMLSRKQKVGIVVADADKLGKAHLQAAGISDEAITIAGMEQQRQFSEVILQGKHNDLDMSVFAQELTNVVDNMINKQPNVGAIVLECTDLSHFAPMLQKRFSLPVFDLTSLVKMVAGVVGQDFY